jgi:hypothetical protein
LLTGSCAPALIAVRKRGSGELAIRRDLRHRVVCERLTGVPQDRTFRASESMERGVELEPDAIGAYESEFGCVVHRVGFVSHDTLRAGCSPDGYVGDWEGVVETKCPDSTTHLEYLKAKVVPGDYAGQLIHALWLTGAQWADFVSFDPRFQDPALRLFVVRMHRKDVDLTAYELAVQLFLSEVDKEVDTLRGLARAAA